MATTVPTERLVLRPFAASDVAAHAEMHADVEIVSERLGQRLAGEWMHGGQRADLYKTMLQRGGRTRTFADV